ncbi:MAG: sigma 54-interacting transcriptional regulator [Myxococcota bacterium]|nr:sigma 54-interacting transcriptional regulator [Myxococcota bacterium]
MPNGQRKVKKASRVACLKVLASPDRAAVGRIHLLGTATYVGREPAEPELVWIADERMAARHCCIRREQDCYLVEDLGRDVGTYVEGVPARRRPIAFGELLRCGDTLLLLADLDLPAVRFVHARSSALVGQSGSLIHALLELEQQAPKGHGLLVAGEPGSGRERLAWEYHRQQGRGGPFLAYDCAASPSTSHLPDLLGEGPAGSPPGGLVAAAGRGTLHLGNIEHLAPSAADALVRSWRPGATGGRATPAALPLGLSGACPPLPGGRTDLTARRRVGVPRALLTLLPLTIALAPLRARREDVLPLFTSFLLTLGPPRRRPKYRQRLHPDLEEALLLHHWPGNIDELRELAGRAVLLGEPDRPLPSSLIGLLGLPRPVDRGTRRDVGEPEAGGGAPAQEEAAEALPPPPPPGQAPSPELLRRCYAVCGGSVRRVALYLQRDRRLVHRWLRRHGVISGAESEDP